MKINVTLGVSALGLALLTSSCQPSALDNPSALESPATAPDSDAAPSPQTSSEPSEVLSKEEVARRFFEAYKTGDRAAALEVATEDAVEQLNWDASAGTNPTLELIDDNFIYYEGGGINLTITGDEQQGYKVTAAQPITD